MNPSTSIRLTVSGQELDTAPECLGEMRSSTEMVDDVELLRGRMREDGYLYLPGYLDRDLALEAREVIVEKLSREGMLDPAFPPMEAVARPGLHLSFKADLARNNAPLMKLLYSGRMMEWFESFLGGPVRHFDYTWMRAVAPGPGTNPHCDVVYMGRGTRNLYTAWTPLGDIPREIGGLIVLEHSPRKADKFRNYLQRDVDTYCTNHPDAEQIVTGQKQWQFDGVLTRNPGMLCEKLGERWLTADYRAGDLVVFGMATIHAGLDNHSNAIRLSSDSRYQLSTEPADERWIGENVIAHGPAGKRGRIC